MNVKKVLLSSFIASFYVVSLPVLADVKLPHVIGSNMVLQRQMAIPVWG